MANDHKYNVTIKFEIVRQGQGLRDVQKELDRTEKKNKAATKSMLGQWTELRSQLLLIKFAFREVAGAVDAVWSSARGGAGITQLTESFKRANDAIFKTPTLLQDMAAASRGTITQANLMEGIMTLTAGTSRDLSQALTTNAAELLGIAKAANRLNPALGDTDFFYKSLTTGIKRASFRILDNLGIVVRVGDANRRWAQEMDRTVESMTAEERQLALLNEVLRVGGRLVEQAGGTTESLTDSYDILSTMLEEVKNKGKEMLDGMLRPLIQDMADARLATIEFEATLAQLFDSSKQKDIEGYQQAFNALERDFSEFVQLQEGQARQDRSLLETIFPNPIEAAQAANQLESTTEDVARVIAAAMLDIDASLSPGLRPGQTPAERFDQMSSALRKLGIDANKSGVQIGGQTIHWRQFFDVMREVRSESDLAAEAARRQGEAEQFREQKILASASAIDDYVALQERYQSGLRKEQALIEVLGTKDLKEYVIAQGEAALSVGESLANNEEFVRSLREMGFDIGTVQIRLGDTEITWRELNDAVMESRLQHDATLGAKQRMAESAEFAEKQYRKEKMALTESTEAVRDATGAYEAFLAARAAAPGAAPETGDFFTSAVGGDLNYFNEELDTLGTHLVFVTDSTIQHQAQVENLREEYDKVAQTITDYNNFAKGATLTDEERAEKIGEYQEQLGILGGKLTELGDIQGRYVETTKLATINEEALNSALFEAVGAAGASALQMAVLGQALGVVTPEVAEAALQNALLAEKVGSLAERYVDGQISIGGMREELNAFITRIQETEVPLGKVTENVSTLVETASNLPEDVEIGVTAALPDDEIGETQTAVDTLADDDGYKIEFFSNSIKLMETDITPLQTALDAIDFEPYEPVINSNAPEEGEFVDAFSRKMLLLNELVVTPTIQIQYDDSLRPPDMPNPGVGGQHGLDFMVPSGYQNDTFGPIWASSGERVTIDPNPASSAHSTHSTQNIFNIDARGAESGSEYRIKRAVKEAMQESGKKANALRRTM